MSSNVIRSSVRLFFDVALLDTNVFTRIHANNSSNDIRNNNCIRLLDHTNCFLHIKYLMWHCYNNISYTISMKNLCGNLITQNSFITWCAWRDFESVSILIIVLWYFDTSIICAFLLKIATVNYLLLFCCGNALSVLKMRSWGS